MKLSDYIKDLGRTIAFYPGLTPRVTHSTNATILLCQFLYWCDKTKDNGGWIYKDSYELEEETSLTYNEQKTAREVLVNLKILEENYKRLDHKIAFRLNLDVLNDIWEKTSGKYPNPRTVVAEQKPLSLRDFQDPALHPDHPAHRSDMERKGDLVDAIIDYSRNPGMQKQLVKDEIRNKIENLLHINTENPKWDRFIEFAYNRQEKNGESIDIFIKWAIKEGWNPIYWTPEKCKTLYPQAFLKENVEREFIESLSEPEEKKGDPVPEEFRRKPKLY